MGSYFLFHTVFTALALYLLILVAAFYLYSFLDACSFEYIFCLHLFVIAFVFLSVPQVL